MGIIMLMGDNKLKEMYYNVSRERTRQKSRSPRRSSKDRRKDRRRSSSSSRDNGRGYREFQKKSRVRFQKDEYLLDIKYFKKGDEPSARNLTDQDMFEYRVKLENENYNNVVMDSEQLKHKESLMEGDAMKKARENEKSFNQKLLLSKEEVVYYPPPFLKIAVADSGNQSTEKMTHSERISSILRCYYSKISEIPDEPNMTTIINDIASNETPKTILFEKTNEKDKIEASKFWKPEAVKETRMPKRGILKKSVEELKKIREQMELEHARNNPGLDPQFLTVLKDIQANKDKYSKEQIELMFKPFKDNGTLEINLKKMKQMSQAPRAPPPFTSHPTPPMTNNPPPTSGYPSYSMMNRMPHSQPQQMTSPMMHMNPHHNPSLRNIRMDKYKTIPCKYYNSPQGCEKKTDCTFIHDDSGSSRDTSHGDMRYRHQYQNQNQYQQRHYPPPQQYQQQYQQEHQGYNSYQSMPYQPHPGMPPHPYPSNFGGNMPLPNPPRTGYGLPPPPAPL